MKDHFILKNRRGHRKHLSPAILKLTSVGAFMRAGPRNAPILAVIRQDEMTVLELRKDG
jgi:hypothetical protein